MSRFKPILDRAVGFLASKKLLAFGIASTALFMGSMTGSEWADVAMVYVGSQAAVDIAERLILARK